MAEVEEKQRPDRGKSYCNYPSFSRVKDRTSQPDKKIDEKEPEVPPPPLMTMDLVELWKEIGMEKIYRENERGKRSNMKKTG